MSKLKNIISRVILFILALPLLAALIIYLPWRHHLGVNILLVIVTIRSTFEAARMLSAKEPGIHTTFVTILSGILPASVYLYIDGLIPFAGLMAVFTGLVTLFLLSGLLFHKQKDREFQDVIALTGKYLMLLIYPGFLISFIVLFSSFTNSTFIIILFMLTVYLNDSFSWLVGMLFGKGTRNIFTVSPNKSLVGFIGGITASATVCLLGALFFPEWMRLHWIPALILGALSGVTTIMGDLVESGFKRSAAIKDSGNVVLGRGGLLDSIDSLLFTAPLFFFIFKLLGQ